MMLNLKGVLVAAAFVLGGAVSAPAAMLEISVATYSVGAYENELESLLGGFVFENFESEGAARGIAGAGQVGASLKTDVGTFTSLGGTGSGGSRIGDGTELALRDRENFGRINTTPDGKWFLDSNDTMGMNWAVATGTMFNKLFFALTDASDQGAMLKITADDGTTKDFTVGAQGNAVLQLVVVTFSDLVNLATVSLSNGTSRNDGFGVDDVTVGSTIAPVPLPAGLLLLGTAIGGFGVARRLRKAA